MITFNDKAEKVLISNYMPQILFARLLRYRYRVELVEEDTLSPHRYNGKPSTFLVASKDWLAIEPLKDSTSCEFFRRNGIRFSCDQDSRYVDTEPDKIGIPISIKIDDRCANFASFAGKIAATLIAVTERKLSTDSLFRKMVDVPAVLIDPSWPRSQT